MGFQFEGVVHSGGGARRGGGSNSQSQEESPGAELLAYTWAWKQGGEGWLPGTAFFSRFIKSGTPVHRMAPKLIQPPYLRQWNAVMERTNACLTSSLDVSFLFKLNVLFIFT